MHRTHMTTPHADDADDDGYAEYDDDGRAGDGYVDDCHDVGDGGRVDAFDGYGVDGVVGGRVDGCKLEGGGGVAGVEAQNIDLGHLE